MVKPKLCFTRDADEVTVNIDKDNALFSLNWLKSRLKSCTTL